jgi:hypothetical protein
LISPVDPKCENRFKFTADGYIQPRTTDDLAAVTTIKKLGLDIPKLRDLRKNAIELFLDEDLSSQDIDNFVQRYLAISQLGEFNEFWTTIKYLFL